MARFPRQIVKTDKHEVTFSDLASNNSVNNSVTLIEGVDVASKNTSTECAVGSHVKWIFCEFNISAETVTNIKTMHWLFRVIPPLQAPSISSALYASDRSYVLKRGMEMLPKDVATVFKRVFVLKIPKVYQRIKDGQKLTFEYVASSTETTNLCGVFVYKEIY